MLDDVLIDDFEGASLPATFPGWTNGGWAVTPFTKYHTQYYLVEWRNATKYDQMVQTAYITTASGANQWTVERVPYNIPGALVYFRNTQYGGPIQWVAMHSIHRLMDQSIRCCLWT